MIALLQRHLGRISAKNWRQLLRPVPKITSSKENIWLNKTEVHGIMYKLYFTKKETMLNNNLRVQKENRPK